MAEVELIPLTQSTSEDDDTRVGRSKASFSSSVASSLHHHHHHHHQVTPAAPSKPAQPTWKCVTAAVAYGVGSGSLVFFNKALVSSFQFEWSNVLLLFQMLFGTVVFGSLRAFHLTSVSQPLSLSICLQLLPLTLMYVINAALGISSLKHLSLPMYSVLKRLTPAVVTALQFVFFHQRVSLPVLTSLVCVSTGLLLAGLGDVVWDGVAYLLALASCVTQALYLVLTERAGLTLKAESDELLFYNSLLSTPFLFVFVWGSGELQQAISTYQHWHDVQFVVALLLMMMLGCSLNYLLFLCTLVNSPLTTTMVGVMKGVLTTLFGFFTFGGQPLTLLNLCGIILNTMGGVLYAVAKYQEKSRTDNSQLKLQHR